MTDATLNTCREQQALIEYLYDELAPAERARFEAHLSTCVECRSALDAMREVRAELAGWQLPEHAGEGAGGVLVDPSRFRPVAAPSGPPASGRPWWAPGALAAAAVILLAVAAAIANLEIRYGHDGISVRTGWSQTPAAPAQAAAASAPSQPAGGVREETVSAGDLAALEQRLRTEFQALSASTPASARVGSASASKAPAESAQVLRRVQDLIAQSEARQRRELALRVAQVVRDFDTQRQTDLVRIQQGLGQIEGSTAADRQLLNYLVRVSQRQK